MEITITITDGPQTVTITKRAPKDKLGHPTATKDEVLKSAADDAKAWLRRQAGRHDGHDKPYRRPA